MTSLLSLPTELLLVIFDFLQPLDKHTFSLSCQHLKYTFTTLCSPLSLDETYTLRSHLARDGLRFTSHAYCAGCNTMHMHKFFNPNQRSLPPSKQRCISTQKALYMEPGQLISYKDASDRESWWPRAYPKNHDLPQLNTGFIMRFGLEHGQRVQEFALCTSYELVTLPDKKFTASKAEVTRILRGFDIPTCPHTKLGDGTVAGSYREALSNSRYTVLYTDKEKMRRRARVYMGTGNHANIDIDLDIWYSSNSDACCRFPGCKTAFRWEYRSDLRRDGWKTLLLHVKRFLGGLLTPQDPRWMVQLVDTPDEEQMMAYVKECFDWRNVNVVIEENRYERVLLAHGQGRKLDRAEECEFEQLRRENDYLRHPHHKQGRLRLTLETAAAGERDKVPATTLLLLEAREGGQKGAEGYLLSPLHSAETVLEMTQGNEFNKRYKSLQELNSYRGRIRSLFRGTADDS
ncbi:hypothetical protein BDW74DRAFT_179021 [Aspergillus multicolor]|uniref:uncharacterized protein n=1 Tax=Aspergillus multicolor TaxID=41759 RepID=UPI003CCDEE7D